MDEYKDKLKEALRNCDSLLDVGCGHISPAHEFFKNIAYTVGIDGYPAAVKTAEENKVHTEQFVFDVRNLDKRFKPQTFDCVMALDLIEHLTKEEGYKLIKDMEAIAIKKIIIFTPNGFVHQNEYDNNQLQVHKSGWTPKEFKNMGYKVTGINGLKYLRTEGAKFKYSPVVFWQRISSMTQKLTRHYTPLAFQLFCVKNL